LKKAGIDKKVANFMRDQFNRTSEGGPSLLARNALLFLMTPSLLLAVLFARILRPFVLIRFGELFSSRIGHFTSNTEVYLCERDLNIHGRKGLDIFSINGGVCNRQLKKMWSRSIRISPFATGLDMINRALPGGERHRIEWRNDQNIDIHGALESTQPHISFTAEEERAGWEALKKFGITGATPFVCFLSRDPAYLDKLFPMGDWRYHDYRDSDIKKFIFAAEELTRRGYFAVRMGAVVKEPIAVKNAMIIDYAAKYRTEFLDLFLGAKCSFYLGDSCGFYGIPQIFRRPMAIVNVIPPEYGPTSSRDIFIPKKLWLRRERRFLTFSEMLDPKIGRIFCTEDYDRAGIEAVENTAEEITSLALEMDQRLNGKWRADDGDEELQKRFWALFKPGRSDRIFLSRIGAGFLRQNKELLKIGGS